MIDDNKIQEILNNSKGNAEDIIKKSRQLKGLSLEQTAVLLNCRNRKQINLMFKTARWIKERIYGKRLVLFAPLYLSNICKNNCLYCNFRSDNKDLKRKKMSFEEIKNEVKVLLKQGHKRLLLVAGEDSDIDYIEKAIHTVYNTRVRNSSIRRVNINLAPMPLNDFKRLKKAGIGTYQLFQETYHKETYAKAHPDCVKSNYEERLYAIDRAIKAGIDDIGIGALFGLYDYKFEVLALLAHSKYLDKKFGIGPHTISVPRIKPANAPLAKAPPAPVSDDDFKKLVAILRMAVPYTGMILTTREKPRLRDEVFNLGISQISAGSRTNPGAYSENREHAPEAEQFHIEDTRSLSEVIKDISRFGFFPSFCTACYRIKRTGKKFMSLAKKGDIKDYCLPNCLLTFKEYLLDYGDDETKKLGYKIIKKNINNIENKNIRKQTILKLIELEKGKRDLFF